MTLCVVRRKRLLCGASVVALSFCLGGQVYAQQLEEVVVTAQKKTEKLQDVPIAISALTGEDIKNMNVINIRGVSLRTSGMVFNTDATFSEPFIRGIGTNFATAGLESSIAQYQDDVYEPRSFGGLLDLTDVGDLEVLKGPQGALYGRNATGGAIIINSNNPTDKEEGSVYVEAGTYGKKVTDFMLNEPLTDTLKMRVAGKWADSDGYIKNIDGHMFGGYDDNQLRAKLEWAPTDRLDVLASTEYTYREGETTGRQNRSAGGVCVACQLVPPDNPAGYYDTIQGSDAKSRVQDVLSILRVTYNFDDFDVTSITSFAKRLFAGSSDEGASLGPFLYDHNDDSSHTFTQEFRVASKFSGPLNFLAGVNYLRDVDDFAGKLSGSLFTGFMGDLPHPLQNQTNVRTDTLSGYVEAYYDLSDAWKITAGGRYSFDRRLFDSQNNDLATAAFGTAGYRAQKNYYNFVPRTVLSYKTDNGNYYLSYSKGFKAGGFNSTAYGVVPPLAPEKLTSTEIGAKNSWFDDRLRTTAAIYHYSYKDVQVDITDVTSGGKITKNAGTAEDTGAELDADFAVTDDLTLSAGGSYTHARYTQFKSATAFIPSAFGYLTNMLPNGQPYTYDLANTPLPNAPDWTAYGAINYKYDLPAGWSGDFNTIFHWVSAYYFSAGAAGPTLTDRQKPYGTLDFTFGVTTPDQNWDFHLYVKNAMETHYANLSATSFLGNYYEAAPPREISVSAEYKFGNDVSPPRPMESAPPMPAPAPAAAPVQKVEARRQFQVFFDFDKSDITEAAAGVIQKAADSVKAGNVTTIQVTGHTDTVGAAAYNQKLSERRAAAVKAALVADGVADGEIATSGVGKTGLLVPTSDGVREPQNRRAQIELK